MGEPDTTPEGDEMRRIQESDAARGTLTFAAASPSVEHRVIDLYIGIGEPDEPLAYFICQMVPDQAKAVASWLNDAVDFIRRG